MLHPRKGPGPARDAQAALGPALSPWYPYRGVFGGFHLHTPHRPVTTLTDPSWLPRRFPGDPVFDFLSRHTRAVLPDAVDARLVDGPLVGEWVTICPADAIIVIEEPDPDPAFQRFTGLRVVAEFLGSLDVHELPGYVGQYVGDAADPSRRLWSPAE